MNISDFWFPIKYILPIIAVVSIIIFIVLFLLLNKVKNTKGTILYKLVFALYISLYIQGNFLNFGYGQLNGSDPKLNTMIVKAVINTFIWIIFMLIPVIIDRHNKNEEKYRKISSRIVIAVMLIEIITISIVYIAIFNYNGGRDIINVNKDFYLDESNLLNMSDEENIVFIMVDSLEGKYITNFLEEYPEYKKVFSDFTFFDNVTSCSVLTDMSMPTLLTGENLEVGKTLQENINNNFEKTDFYKILNENGYQTEYYTELALVPTNTKNEIISNKVDKELEIDISSKIKLSSLLQKCVYYKYMPHILKSFFYFDTNQFNHVTTNGINSYFIDDVNFNKKIIEDGISNSASNKTFKVIQLNGIHYPFNVDSSINYNETSEYYKEKEEVRQQNQLLALIKILENYVNALKESNVYDNTTIIISADHGFENRYNPALLVKRNNEHNDELIVNSAPISENEDFIPTILNIATDSKNYGKDIYDYKEGEERNRKINNYYFARDSRNITYIESNIIIGTDSKAIDKDSYYIVDEEFCEINNLKKEYKLGKNINFSSSNNKYAITNGILMRSGDNASYGTFLGRNAEIKIMPRKAKKDVRAEMTISKVFLDNQKIVIKSNNKVLYDKTFDKTNKKFIIAFDIPKEIWNKNKYFTLEFELPNAGTYSNEYLDNRYGTDWLIRSIELKNVKFK